MRSLQVYAVAMRLCRLFAVYTVFLAAYALAASKGVDITYNKKIETDILKGYNSKHRPVKAETTSVQVQIFISITHVEKVDEHEQTMMVHGHLWATWVDEYLNWNPAKYNGTEKVNIEAWKIWQPALALYNSARGNTWYLYMNGMPAIINKEGKVWVSGAFSFFVTCRFDFTDWPYDTQDCPIVISDWVYDLSRVNLSDPGDIPWKNPMVKLNYDPQTTFEKKHVAGWEVADTWRRHCYWGPTGCKDSMPEGQVPEWYWSLLEFGVRLKRHAPYLGIIIVLPTIVSCLVNLLTFWIDNYGTTISLLTVNMLIQGIFGWDLIRELPPGSGGIPHIVFLYAMNLALTANSFIAHVIYNWLGYVTPTDVTFPIRIESLPRKLGLGRFFEAKGLSFDPQSLMAEEQAAEESKNFNSPLASIHSSTVLEEQPDSNQQNLIPLENAPQPQQETSSSELVVSIPVEVDEPPKPTEEVVNPSLQRQLYILRRTMFCVYAIIYIIIIPYGVF